MLRPSAKTSQALIAVLALTCACPAVAAEGDKEKRAAYMGMSREQIYAKLGDPRNLMKAGPREIMFFPHLKLTLRNGFVIDVEDVLDEPAPRRAAAETPAAAPVPPAPEAVDPTGGKKPGAVPGPDANVPKSVPVAAPVAEPAPAPAPNLEIKSVRPPSAGAARPVTKAPPRAPEPAPANKSPAQVVVVPVRNTPIAVVVPPTPAPVAPTMVPTPSGSTPAAPTTPAVSVAAAATEMATATSEKSPEPATDTPAVAAPNSEPQKLAPKRSLFRRHTAGDDDLPEQSIFTAQTYILGAALLGAIGYLIWWRRQRSLELTVTTVSNTPFDEALPTDNSAMFTAELLAKLEWKRFEELVAAYYIKTGVVAVRTNAGPGAPVHLKISWKGETKPFAGVQCHSNPPGLIRSGPLQQLADALTAADIRRGYVVTNGKFNVEARDIASEKHFTLLSGDILLEKLNALPPAARSELMHEIMEGDYSTPTCPKCDVKMVRADEKSWRCANHPRCEQTMPPRKI